MAKGSDFEAIREIKARLSTTCDDAVAALSSKALSHVKNILKSHEKTGQTVAYHNIAQKHEKLDEAVERTNESMQFLNQSQGKLKQDWQAIVAGDAESTREALFALLSVCESLDTEDTALRANTESKTLAKIVNGLKKTKNSDPKSCATFAKGAIEFEKSLIILDSIIAGTEYPGENFDIYSKFSHDLEDLGERNRRLGESLHFLKDEYSKVDWEHFMGRDLEKLKEVIQTSHESSMKLINSVT
jgi:hypothetical protein